MPDSSVVIWGAGAIGGTFGAFLARAGKKVLFVERAAEHVAAINEGGMGMLNFLGANRPVFAAAPAEKGPLWLRLRASGRPGHGSVPHADNSVDKLARALVAIQGWERATTVQPMMQAVVDELHASMQPF